MLMLSKPRRLRPSGAPRWAAHQALSEYVNHVRGGGLEQIIETCSPDRSPLFRSCSKSVRRSPPRACWSHFRAPGESPKLGKKLASVDPLRAPMLTNNLARIGRLWRPAGGMVLFQSGGDDTRHPKSACYDGDHIRPHPATARRRSEVGRCASHLYAFTHARPQPRGELCACAFRCQSHWLHRLSSWVSTFYVVHISHPCMIWNRQEFRMPMPHNCTKSCKRPPAHCGRPARNPRRPRTPTPNHTHTHTPNHCKVG